MKEMQIKMTVKFHLTLARMATKETRNAGEDAGKGDSHTAGGNGR
jgi:hypothetical protein